MKKTLSTLILSAVVVLITAHLQLRRVHRSGRRQLPLLPPGGPGLWAA